MNSTFTTVATFIYSSEAKIIQGRLASEGIETFLRDAITIDTDPFVSNAIGGVKLDVYTKDLAKAKDVLASISEFSVSDQGDPVECPNCGSDQIHYFSHIKNAKALAAFVFAFFVSTLPFYTKYDYTCEVCKTKFSNV